MADPGDSGVFSADLQALQRGGVNMKHIAEVAASIFGDLHNTITQYPNPGGDGDIGKSVEMNYTPNAKAGLEFLQNLKTLLDTHGTKTIDLSNLFNGVDTSASIDAGGHGKKP